MIRKVSIIIPVYNEIRFIRKTLESAVNEADEIILSDNASNDGTSEICQEFAKKYKNIRYTRHKENIGGDKNGKYCIDTATGVYIRIMGAHDMISPGSTQSMLKIMEKDYGIAMVYSKCTVFLDSDYSIINAAIINEYGSDLLSDSPFVRVKSMIKNIRDFSIFFGLYKADILKKAYSNQIFKTILSTDHAVLSTCASQGKIAVDDKSIFYRMNQHQKNEDHQSSLMRIIKNIYNNSEYNPLTWELAVICEQYNLSLKMQETVNAPSDYSEDVLNILLEQFKIPSFVSIPFENLPEVLPEKHLLLDEVCKKMIKQKEMDIKSKRNYLKILKSFKRVIKWFLPYGAVKLAHRLKTFV